MDAQGSYRDVPAKVETVWDYRPSGGDVEVWKFLKLLLNSDCSVLDMILPI